MGNIISSERKEEGDLPISTSERREWGDLPAEFILKIFKELNPKDRCTAAQVSRSWRVASLDPSLSLQVLRSNIVRVDTRALGLSEALRTVVASVHGNITSIIFHPRLRIKDEDVNLIAEGCPHLKRLILPCWDLISERTMFKVIKGWPELESITLPGFSKSFGVRGPILIIVNIKEHCESFSTLKVMGLFSRFFAASCGMALCGLKVLSLRCCRITMQGFDFLEYMRHLEVLNLSHTLVQLDEGSEAMPLVKAFETMDGQRAFKMLSSMNLRSLLYCQNYISCSECRRMMDDHMTHEDESWRNDEVDYLELGEYNDIANRGATKEDVESLRNDEVESLELGENNRITDGAGKEDDVLDSL